MDMTIEIDLGQAARECGLPLESVQNTVVLLDDGNTVPFITRFRKDLTGALDEEQVRRIQEKVGKLRALAERKQTILKSIQAQGIMTPELLEQIRAATSSKRLEDLYLPYKPKKQTLATTARQRGLEPLAREVLDADPAAADLPARAASLVAEEQELRTADDVLAGVRHIIAEWFSERAEVRGRLRKVLQRTAKLNCSRVDPAARREAADAAESAADPTVEAALEEPDAHSDVGGSRTAVGRGECPTGNGHAGTALASGGGRRSNGRAGRARGRAAAGRGCSAPAEVAVPEATSAGAMQQPPEAAPVEASPAADEVVENPAAPPDESTTGAHESPTQPLPPMSAVTRKVLAKKRRASSEATSKKEKKRQRLEAAFKDYFAFQESISRIPPHRILAINRGERARILRVKMDADMDAMTAEAEKLLIPAGHPHADFLRSCVRNALNRLLIPSLERELRREMAEVAEEHAVEVFARNLRKLLLQPPVYNHRVLAVDPGFRSGCKLIALDEFGNVLGHEIIHVIGREDWIRAGRAKLVELIRRHRLSVIAIGNGAGCRETEQLVVDVMDTELKDEEVAFVIVNEAGASVYSTSPVGREELPTYDAVLRSAISIGRRLLDPLSELVKINPANIGVGMYQHDVKAKHLRNSLDAVVESCVNYVGVDVNTASPALLRYVSGMNQLTARRLCEYRSKHGPFRSRDQLKQVPDWEKPRLFRRPGSSRSPTATIRSTRPGFIRRATNSPARSWPRPAAAWRIWSILLPSPLRHLRAWCRYRKRRARNSRPRWSLTHRRSPADVPSTPVEVAERCTLENVAPAAESSPADGSLDGQSATAQPPVLAGEADNAETVSMGPELSADGAGGEGSSPIAPTTLPEPTASEHAVPSDPTADAAGPIRGARDRVRQLDAHGLADELSVSEVLLRDILNSLARPGRDPREDFPAPVFRRGIVKLEDLQPGMTLSGTVLNVVDFGAFVDIGLPDSGLVHISRLADRFVRDPHEVVGVGDVLTVWVVDIDKQRRRVSLTAIEPGTEKPAESRREPPPQRPRRPPAKRPAGRAAEGTPAGKAKSHAAGDRAKTAQRPRPPHKPKFVKPITKEMEEGKEPLRSFSDLMQFYQKKQPDEN